jgi:hypothetical protein
VEQRRRAAVAEHVRVFLLPESVEHVRAVVAARVYPQHDGVAEEPPPRSGTLSVSSVGTYFVIVIPFSPHETAQPSPSTDRLLHELIGPGSKNARFGTTSRFLARPPTVGFFEGGHAAFGKVAEPHVWLRSGMPAARANCL